MAPTRAKLVLAFGGLSVAVAAWLVPASVHIVGWDGDTARRVALLAPMNRLALLLAGTLAVTYGLGSRCRPATVQRLSILVAPLTVLLLWVVPYLPLLPDRVPLLMVLAGPMRWILAGVALTGCLLAAAREGLVRVPIFLRRPPGPRTVFALSLVVFLMTTAHFKRFVPLTGDEPHYLVITHSLAFDGDLRIENNHEQGDYRVFHERFLPPHYIARGLDGVLYSIHAPGVPAALVPAYLVAGQWGAVAAMLVVTALTSTAVFLLARRLTTPGIALATWASVCLTVPFVLQSWRISPEMPAAAVTAFAALWLWSPTPSRILPWVIRGAAIGLLPWFHVKYSLLLMGLTVCLLVKQWPRWRLSLAFLGPMALSGVAWLTTFYVMYGRPDPTAPYGGASNLDLAYIPRGVLGLLFDQEFGLLLYSPIYILAGLGCVVMLRRAQMRWPTLGMLITFGVFTASVAQYYMWWGGYSIPARFLVPALPLVAPMIAVAMTRLRAPVGVGVSGALLGASVVALVALVYRPAERLMFNTRDGSGLLVEAWQGGVALTGALPTFIDIDWMRQLPLVLVWVGAAAVGLVSARMVGRQSSLAGSTFWAGATFLMVFGGVGSGLAALGGPPGDLAETARRGQQALLRAHDGDRFDAYALSPPARLTTEQFLETATIRWFADDHGATDTPVVAGPFVLSPGRYDVSVSFRPGAARGKRVWLRYHVGPPLLADQAVIGDGPVVMTVDVPVEFDAVWVGGDDRETADAVTAVEIRPRQVEARRDRTLPPDIVTIRALEPPGRFLLFLDEETFQEPNRWWIRGDSATSLLVSPDGARRMTVQVRRPAASGDTLVQVADVVRQFDMRDTRSHEVTFELAGDETVVPLTVSCAGGFRPAEVNPESNDQRYLGCEVTVELF